MDRVAREHLKLATDRRIAPRLRRGLAFTAHRDRSACGDVVEPDERVGDRKEAVSCEPRLALEPRISRSGAVVDASRPDAIEKRQVELDAVAEVRADTGASIEPPLASVDFGVDGVEQ